MSAFHLLFPLAASVCASGLLAQTDTSDYRETVASGDDASTYVREYCLDTCDCVGHVGTGALSGGFTLRFSHNDFWTSYYDVVDVELFSTTPFEPQVHYVGTGTYEIGGDFAYTHRLTLNLVPLHEPDPGVHLFDSGTKLVSQASQFPAIVISASTEVAACTQRTLNLRTTAVALPSCVADIGSTGGVAGRDGRLDNNDFVVFIDAFFGGDPLADRGVQGGVPGSDGVYDNNDFVVFIDQFFGGC
ncbi:MAG: GC-type dockerin domain-anchored protein [Phycisphaerales bacterium]|nr:GC-type dockerin domain-anchored protein [Phycisphaerales bacterium]